MATLLEHISGAGDPSSFRKLPERVRRRAIAELRTRSIAYRTIAAVTGISTSGVRRLHISRDLPASDETAVGSASTRLVDCPGSEPTRTVP
ncbi:hypothetical protein [Micropruina sp.]|uniref:hypothetical protein n=1 Tax=Micropruina sp. TaxID=2737536 RepID=UPI0039E47C36